MKLNQLSRVVYEKDASSRHRPPSLTWCGGVVGETAHTGRWKGEGRGNDKDLEELNQAVGKEEDIKSESNCARAVEKSYGRERGEAKES